MGDAFQVHVQARAAFLRAMGAAHEGYTPLVFGAGATRDEVLEYYRGAEGAYPTALTLLKILEAGETVGVVAIPRGELYEEFERGAAVREGQASES